MLAPLARRFRKLFGSVHYRGNGDGMGATERGSGGDEPQLERWKGLLAARGEAAVVGHGHPEVLVRIHRGIVYADFVVEVRAGMRPLSPT